MQCQKCGTHPQRGMSRRENKNPFPRGKGFTNRYIWGGKFVQGFTSLAECNPPGQTYTASTSACLVYHDGDGFQKLRPICEIGEIG